MGVWRHRRVLITGAGGFLGSWVSQTVVTAGACAVRLLRPTTRRPSFLSEVEERGEIVWGDLSDLAEIQRVLNEEEIEVVYHLAAQAAVGVANRSPLSTFESNIRGTYHLLEACRLSPWVKAIVVASSDKAYGAQAILPYQETSPLQATHPYDVSKACADMLARTYATSFGLPVAVTRMANLYGPGDRHASRIVPSTIRSALRGDPIVIRSDGTPERDFLYVEDAAAADLRLAEALIMDRSLSGRAFNFGTGRPVSVLAMVQAILQVMERPNHPVQLLAAGPILGEIDRQYIDSGEAERVLGWRATTSLREGLQRTVESVRSTSPLIGT